MSIQVKGQKPAESGKCLIIAEAGVNHNGDLSLARKLVHAAVDAGVDAIKFQTFKADRLVTEDAPKAEYQKRQTGSEESQGEMLRKLELSENAHVELIKLCKELGITFLSTPFDEESASFLNEIGIPIFKMSSGELTNLPLLRHVARFGKPMIVSTGMATLAEVKDAVDCVEKEGNLDVTLLQCVSNYPAKFEDVNLRAMMTMAKEFGIPVGYSDHTPGIEIPMAAVALGASVIEKHLTLDKSLPGPDHQASLDPVEFKKMVQGIRNVELSLGDGRKVPAPSEKNTADVARRSIVAARDIPAGVEIVADMLVLRRPGDGLPPKMLSSVLGKLASRNIRKGQKIFSEDLRNT